jgi:hypothetical protein
MTRLRREVFVTEAELKKHLDPAEKSLKQIAAAVLGLPEKTLRYKPSPDKWCIWEILGQPADMEILYAYRIRQMLADKDAVIAPIDQDAGPRIWGIWSCRPRSWWRSTDSTASPCAVALAIEGGRLVKVRTPS